MYALQECKTVAAQSNITAGNTNSLVIDTLNYDAASVNIILGTAVNASNTPALIQIYQSESTNATTFTSNIWTQNGEVFVGSGYQSAITSASQASTNYTAVNTVATNPPDILTFDLALNAAQARYLQVSVAASTNFSSGFNHNVAIVANLYRGEIAPSTAALKNVALWAIL